jgi:HSP20 family protein
MASLIEWNPFRDLEKIRSDFDDLMERFWRKPPWPEEFEEAVVRPRLESFIEDGKLTIRADLPGIDPKNIEVTVCDNELNVRAKRQEERETKKRDFLRREVKYGSYEYSTDLPKGLKAEDLKASYKDGVLELTAAMAKELLPKQVKVQVEAAGPKKIEAKEKSAA